MRVDGPDRRDETLTNQEKSPIFSVTAERQEAQGGDLHFFERVRRAPTDPRRCSKFGGRVYAEARRAAVSCRYVETEVLQAAGFRKALRFALRAFGASSSGYADHEGCSTGIYMAACECTVFDQSRDKAPSPDT